MRRGTTPTHVFKVKIDLEDLEKVFITYMQNDEVVVEKDIDSIIVDAENKTLTTRLTQEETLKFSSGVWDRMVPNERRDNKVKIQIRLKYEDGSASASKIIVRTVDEILKEGEI